METSGRVPFGQIISKLNTHQLAKLCLWKLTVDITFNDTMTLQYKVVVWETGTGKLVSVQSIKLYL